ncbi:hypothetical protein B0T09DRAFT_54585 [Sordaria sp. MPI-SDFR-AT-0083]|nr:hypothetical protein B0T09DRAFT_54585 [Sordaria sp. MPI-SDFR-AT-0083]
MRGWWSQLGGALTPPTVADMIKFKDRLTVSKFDREHGKCNPPTPLQLAQCCVPNRRHHPYRYKQIYLWDPTTRNTRTWRQTHNHLTHAVLLRYQQTHHQLHLLLRSRARKT